MHSTRNTASCVGKLPNILVLCDDSKKQGEISEILKSRVANDRYAIYGIAWDELAVGGWADVTAHLVVSGKIPDPNTHVPILLQFLGNGGRLLALCCESAPFGPNSASPVAEAGSQRNEILIYGSSETKPISVSSALWGVSNEAGDLPPGFQPQLETTDSDGNSRPLTASVFARIKDSNETVVIQLDGGALGGKAVLSRFSGSPSFGGCPAASGTGANPTTFGDADRGTIFRGGSAAAPMATPTFASLALVQALSTRDQQNAFIYGGGQSSAHGFISFGGSGGGSFVGGGTVLQAPVQTAFRGAAFSSYGQQQQLLQQQYTRT